MPESDDEYERKSREKFARERDYGDRNRVREFNADRGRRDFSNGIGGGGLKRPLNRRDDEFATTAAVPVAKRNRFDSASDSFEPQFVRPDGDAQPILLTFRRFLATQDEASVLNDEDAINKYLQYKLDFKKRECAKYFQEHKDEEWFRLKYHPEESKTHKAQQQSQVRKRLEIFNEFYQNGRISKIALDFVNAADIIRLMDAVVIKLEGGSDEAIDELEEEELDDESVIEAAKLKGEQDNKDKESNGSAASSNGVVNDASVVNSTTNITTGSTNNNVSSDVDGNVLAQNGGAGSGTLSVKKEPEDYSKKKKLHKTCSIHFRNIPANAKFSDLENICKQHPGLLRVGLTDLLPDAKLNRHGWVTYRRDVNIKEIFWNMKNAKLNGMDLGAVVNRDLKRRVRGVSGVTVHRSVAQNDIRQAAKLIVLYDHKAQLYVDDMSSDPIEDLEKAVVESKNPLLAGAVDYLVEESSAEEETYLSAAVPSTASLPSGLSGSATDDAKYTLELDKELLKVLDTYLLYLRVVHSVDYYNCSEYANEDSMPNRLGLIHVRGPPPSKSDPYVRISPEKNAALLLSKKFVDEYITTLNQRFASTLLKRETQTEEELDTLGRRDAEKAVEEFIEQNCVELSKEKWLCPLSGKKFKGPEFIHKHLQSKHAEKLKEVREEVLYFNNFIMDSSRPRNPDPPKVSLTQQSSNSSGTSEFERQGPPHFDGNRYRGGWNNRPGGRAGYMGGGGFNGRMPRYFDSSTMGSGLTAPQGGNIPDGARKDPRPQVAYRDLDAPEEIF